MKLSKIVTVLFIALSIVSCKSDDDGAEVYVYSKANLEGTYALTYFVSTEVETNTVNGFEVITTTTSTGSVFDFDVMFRADNIAVADGTYLLNQTIVQGSNTNSDSVIIDVDNEESPYVVSAGSSLLTLDGSSYQVTSFNETSMTITLEEIDTESNGDTVVYNEELRFTKQ